jgi:hypothetical protein
METGIILGIYLIEIIKYGIAFCIIYKEQRQRRWGYCAGGALLLIYLVLEGGNPERDYLVSYVMVFAMTVFAVSGKAKDRILKKRSTPHVPLATSGSSGMGKTNQELAPSCPGAILKEGRSRCHTINSCIW